MEQHRTLLIIVSVTLFVAVVIGVGLALLYPRDSDEGEQAVAATDGKPFDPIEYIRTPDKRETDFIVPGESEDDDVIIVYGEKPEERQGDADAPGKDALPKAEKEPDTTAKAEPEAEPEAAPREPAKSMGEAAPPAERPEPRPEPEPEYRRVTEYWIQVISSPSRDRVEEAKQRLQTQELGGRITSKNVDGETFYRLRVGPYSHKNEAEKFLEWISDIEGFDESYISEEYPLKQVSN
ncbi:MAG: SPOR domain-containing protein [Spirochaetota bacterium]